PVRPHALPFSLPLESSVFGSSSLASTASFGAPPAGNSSNSASGAAIVPGGFGGEYVTVSWGRSEAVDASLEDMYVPYPVEPWEKTSPWLPDGVLTQRWTSARPAALSVTVCAPVVEPVSVPSAVDPRSFAPSAPAVCHAAPEAYWFQVACDSTHARFIS